MFGSFTTLYKQNSNAALTNPVLMSGLYGFTSHLKKKKQKLFFAFSHILKQILFALRLTVH